MQIILVKLTLYGTEKCKKKKQNKTKQKQKKKKKRFIFWQNPIKVKQKPPKKQTISIPYLLQAQPALALLLLACNCGSTTMFRRNGNCVDPNQTDFY